MTPESLKGRRLVGLFLLGCILFNYPTISLFNINVYWFGFPVLYVYVFGTWFFFTLLIIFVTNFDINVPPAPGQLSEPD
jgi:hypothetical protein